MCGRFSIPEKEVLEERFNAKSKLPLKPRYNAAPSQELPIISNNNPKSIILGRWGLVPHWSKDGKQGIINARAETVAEKPAFKHAFENNRCLILADGFYEWQKRTRGKIPYRITLKTEQPFAFAGIYVLYDDMPTFSIITTEPNALMAKIHDRMPVILHQSQEKMWLEGFLKNQDLSSYLRAYPANEMKAYPISPAVNSPKNDSIEVTYPLKSLFRQIRNK